MLKFADLVVPNQEAVRLKWDFEFLRQLGSQLPEDSALAQTANFTANEMMNVFRKNDLESVAATRKVAENTLGKDWQARILKDSDEVEAQQGTLWAIGHWYVAGNFRCCGRLLTRAAVTSTRPGSGPSVSPSRNPRAPGRPSAT